MGKAAQRRSNMEKQSYLEKKVIKQMKEAQENTFHIELAYELQVASDVVDTMMSLEEARNARERVEILVGLDECKERIVRYLEAGLESEAEARLFDTAGDQASIQAKANQIVFAARAAEEEERWRRRAEQTAILNFIDEHTEGGEAREADMNELVEWMTKFTFEVSWDDIAIPPIELREAEENESYRCVLGTLQGAHDCVRKLNHLVEVMVSDDTYDILAGKVPLHLLSIKKRKGHVFRELWCSQKLRAKLEQYETMRSEIKEDPKRPDKAAHEKQITVLTSDDEPKNTPFKELECSLLREIWHSWKDASLDVVFYVKETMFHRFSKVSCQKRLQRALLILEFVIAAMEGKHIESSKTQASLKQSQSTVKKLKQETARLQKEVGDAQKQLQSTKNNVAKLKKQVKSVTKDNDQLTAQVTVLDEQVLDLERKLQEYHGAPTREEFDEYMVQVEGMRNEVTTLKRIASDLKFSLATKTTEYEEAKLQLYEEKEYNLEILEEFKIIEEEKRQAELLVNELQERLASQQLKVESLTKMIRSKDKMISALKEEADDLKRTRKGFSSRKNSDALIFMRKNSMFGSVDNLALPSDIMRNERELQHSRLSAFQLYDHYSSAGSLDGSTSRLSLGLSKELLNDAARLHQESPGASRAGMHQPVEETITMAHQYDTSMTPPVRSKLSDDMSGLSSEDSDDLFRKSYHGMYADEESHLLAKRSQGLANRRQLTTPEIIQRERRSSEDIDKEALLAERERNRRRHDAANRHLYEAESASDAESLAKEEERKRKIDEQLLAEKEARRLSASVQDEAVRLEQEMLQFSNALNQRLKDILGGGQQGEDIGETSQTSGGKRRGSFTPRVDVNPQFNIKGVSPGTLESKNQQSDKGQTYGSFSAGGSPKHSLDVHGKAETRISSPRSREESSEGSARRLSAFKQHTDSGGHVLSALTHLPSGATKSSSGSEDGSKVNFLSFVNAPSKKGEEKEAVIRQIHSSFKPTQAPVKRPLALKKTYKNTQRKTSKVEIINDSTLLKRRKETKEPETNKRARSYEKFRDDDRDSFFKPSAGRETMSKQREGNIAHSPQPVGVTFSQESSSIGFQSSTTGDRSHPGISAVEKKDIKHRGSLSPIRNSKFLLRHRSSISPIPSESGVDASLSPQVSWLNIGSPPGIKKPRRGTRFEMPGRSFEQSVTSSLRSSYKPSVTPSAESEARPASNHAENFVKQISSMVGCYFSQMNTSLVEALQAEKQRMWDRLTEAERSTAVNRLQIGAELAQLRKGKEEAEIQLKEAEKTIKTLLKSKTEHRYRLDSGEGSHVILPKHVIDLQEEKQRLVALSNTFARSIDEYRNKSSELELRLRDAERANRQSEIDVNRARREVGELRHQLQEVRRSETQKLFMTLRSHKCNYEEIERSEDLNPKVKQAVLSLLRRSMAYPNYRLVQLIRKYRQVSTIQSCVTKVKLKIEKLQKKPLEDAKKRVCSKSKHREQKALDRVLERLQDRAERVDKKWAEWQSDASRMRQKILMRLALLLHKVRDENSKVKIIEPIIVEAGLGGKSVNEDERCRLDLVLPRCPQSRQIIATPLNSKIQKKPPQPEGGLGLIVSNATISPSHIAFGHKWCPDKSTFCPFSNRTGLISLNESANLNADESHELYQRFKVNRPPRLLEMDVRSDLRRAKSILFAEQWKNKKVPHISAERVSSVGSSFLRNSGGVKPTLYESFLPKVKPEVDSYRSEMIRGNGRSEVQRKSRAGRMKLPSIC